MNSEAPERSTRLTSMALRREQDVVLCRNRARTIAATLRFDRQQQVRIATAISEIARNAFGYAGGGRAEFAIEPSDPQQRFRIRISDKGKGIANLQSGTALVSPLRQSSSSACPCSQSSEADWSMIPLGTPTKSFSARRQSAASSRRSTFSPYSSVSASAVAHSRAADDDSAAPRSRW